MFEDHVYENFLQYQVWRIRNLCFTPYFGIMVESVATNLGFFYKFLG